MIAMLTIPSVGGGFVVNEKTKGSQYSCDNLFLLTLHQSMRTCSTRVSTKVPYTELVYIRPIVWRKAMLSLPSLKPMIQAIHRTLLTQGIVSLR